MGACSGICSILISFFILIFIVGQILSIIFISFFCRINIQDVLSENVEIVKDKDGVFKSLKIVETGKDGKTIVEGDNKVTFQDGTQNVTLKAGYNSKTKTITLDFPAEYQLNAEYTYKVIANIDATEKAYENYRKN